MSQITKPLFIGKTRHNGFLLYVRPYNQFGDVVVSFKTESGGFSDHPMKDRPKIFKADRYPHAITVARQLQSQL